MDKETNPSKDGPNTSQMSLSAYRWYRQSPFQDPWTGPTRASLVPALSEKSHGKVKGITYVDGKATSDLKIEDNANDKVEEPPAKKQKIEEPAPAKK